MNPKEEYLSRGYKSILNNKDLDVLAKKNNGEIIFLGFLNDNLTTHPMTLSVDLVNALSSFAKEDI